MRLRRGGASGSARRPNSQRKTSTADRRWRYREAPRRAREAPRLSAPDEGFEIGEGLHGAPPSRTKRIKNKLDTTTSARMAVERMRWARIPRPPRAPPDVRFCETQPARTVRRQRLLLATRASRPVGRSVVGAELGEVVGANEPNTDIHLIKWGRPVCPHVHAVNGRVDAASGLLRLAAAPTLG